MSADTADTGDGNDVGDGEEREITTEEIAEYCCWWVLSEKHQSKKSYHIPFAVRDPLLTTEGGGSPNDPENAPKARPLCGNGRDVPWIVKGHAVLPPGWVEDEQVCSLCKDRFRELTDEGVSDDGE